jgi:hypothetical protein
MTTFAVPPHTTATPAGTGANTPSEGAAHTRPSVQQGISRSLNITDQYFGLLDDLTSSQRRGLIAKLSNGYYDGWQPTRAQLIRYIQNEFGVTARDQQSPQRSADAPRPY